MTDLFSALREMHAFDALRDVLREEGIPTARSWGETMEKIIEHWDGSLEELLINFYEELRIFGRKHVFLFDPLIATKILVNKLRNCDPNSIFSHYYPLPIDKKNSNANKPYLTKVIEDDDSLLLVFCSFRTISLEEHLDKKWLKTDAPEEIKHAEDIRLVKKRTEQAYDVVVIPKNDGPIEIRVDLFHYATRPPPIVALDNIRVAFRSLVKSNGIGGPIMNGPVNLLSLIDTIYEDKEQGNITELAFLCSTNARRREVMSSKGEDLRQEKYHVKGIEAVDGQIDIFRLGVSWFDDYDEKNGEAHVLFPGTLAIAKGTSSELFEARIGKLTRKEDFRFIIERLWSLLDEERS